MVRYRECQRNHAAHLGGHVLDGCGEFMPAGEDGTPEALKCAACNCHRNFHRREANGETTTTSTPQLLPRPPLTTANCYVSFTSTTPNLIKPQKNVTISPRTLTPHHNHQPPRPPLMGPLGGGAAAESSSEDRAGNFPAAAEQYYGVSKKRFRTKFTAEQKEKMAEFAERIGWRIWRQSEGEVQRFCEEVGIKRKVFKVWLHNNKQAIKRINKQS